MPYHVIAQIAEAGTQPIPQIVYDYPGVNPGIAAVEIITPDYLLGSAEQSEIPLSDGPISPSRSMSGWMAIILLLSWYQSQVTALPCYPRYCNFPRLW